MSATGMKAMTSPSSSSKNSFGYSAPSDPARTADGEASTWWSSSKAALHQVVMSLMCTGSDIAIAVAAATDRYSTAIGAGGCSRRARSEATVCWVC